MRIFQGKEIDFLKTGTRWQMSSGLRKHLKQLPYFLLYNYPKKLKTYNTLKEKNKAIESKEDKLRLNAYHSPSPMNELCDYICTWEKKNIMWNNNLKYGDIYLQNEIEQSKYNFEVSDTDSLFTMFDLLIISIIKDDKEQEEKASDG